MGQFSTTDTVDVSLEKVIKILGQLGKYHNSLKIKLLPEVQVSKGKFPQACNQNIFQAFSICEINTLMELIEL